MSSQVHELERELRGPVEDAGLFLEGVRIVRAGKYSRLEVVVDLVDGPGGVCQEQLIAVTRAVSDEVDRLDPIGGAYTLEVTTPGVERELVTDRHFRRATGHRVEVVTRDGTTVRGTLEATTDTGVRLDDREIARADIASAAMVVEF